MRAATILTALLAIGFAVSCKKGDATGVTSDARSAAEMTGCDHDLRSDVVVKHSWPYPAESRNLRWLGKYKQMKLKLKPTPAAFFTATVTYEPGELIEVQDGEVLIEKPRRLVAKRDLFVKHKVWDQGIEVERTTKAVAQGEVGSFLFYNSRGQCMVDTEHGPGWTPCTLDDAFEGLSAEHPSACGQVWWVKVQKSRVDRGWMPFEPEFMERVPPEIDSAK